MEGNEMRHNKAKKMLISYLNGALSKKEKVELELHILNCKDCQNELNELKKIICVLKRAPGISIEEKSFLRTKNLVYKALSEKTSRERANLILVPILLLCLITFIFSNLLFYNILSKIFKEYTPFVFYAFLGYQFSGIVLFFASLIDKFKGGMENGKIVLR